MRPTTTGETANGRSMTASNRALPGNRNRAIVHAAATPKRTFNATEQGATIKVSKTECRVSGSAVRLCQYAPNPALNASANTATTGTTTNIPRNPAVNRLSDQRTQ